ncbi:hypothetical protein SARC_01170 [Sphaeroforma arctica JP610]|uniref:Uncharacterized protein n=1 Tax=Sphaeroforma arctica JP610 TaxID=667725 RepID=A0A0L0GCR9_9EUKA|nr:hypothetical protein SARC_01170 [Sphaeroforma arctica JP610]KNC86704.1 hypothetical protein SARC_01170 [Sphaeroforma arctica JP610]|eukprot:XP_014160606.1 hypothetical protein SARC_01170 [Sphaeroforma arctica JP610]
MDVRKYLDYAVTALLYSAAGLTGLVANIIYKEYKRLQDDSARSQLESSNGGLVLIGLNTKKIIQPSRTGASSGAGRDVSLVNCVVDSDFWRRVKDSIYRIIAQLYTGKTAIQRATEQLAVDQARALTRVSPQNLQFEDEVPGKRYLHDESTINALSERYMKRLSSRKASAQRI